MMTEVDPKVIFKFCRKYINNNLNNGYVYQQL